MHPLVQEKRIDPQENLGVLLIEFLELYGKHFNYDDLGIGLDRDHTWYYSKVI
jgi:non-canonical poly(A) RNA polymerase PAPD5/7